MATTQAQPPPPTQQQPPTTAAVTESSSWPLYDLFIELPHPVASPKSVPYFVVGPPDKRSEIVIQELGSDAASIARIARFAFPEHDDKAPLPPVPPEASGTSGGGAGLNRFDVYWSQHKGFQQHTFSLQLSDGTRVHGHVRRYLPPHLQAPTRYDVGRRGVRALVLLTRTSGGDQLFASILKSIEAISYQQASTPKVWHPSQQPQVAFLHALSSNHVLLSKAYAAKPEDKKVPMVLTLQGAELGHLDKAFLQVDTSRFLLPTCLLQPRERGDDSHHHISSGSTVEPLLPLLRCLGVSNTLRLLSALLSERRILMISSSPTRLATCARSAISMLAQGLLHWQHLFIPVLPPHLLEYLAAPMPYLIGMCTSLYSKLDQMPELGELLVIHLDVNEMETRGMHPGTVATKIPDLFSGAMTEQSMPYANTSASEELAADLSELLKLDRRTITGESELKDLAQETAKKAKKAVKAGFAKLKEKGRQYMKQSSSGYYDNNPTPPPERETSTVSSTYQDQTNHQAADYIYTEACQNEAGEEEARIAFTSFFLIMLGDMRWYLSYGPGQPPTLDKNKFIQSKRALGDGEGTPMFSLLTNFINTQVFEHFAHARVEEVKTRQGVTRDAPLFLLCASYHRSNKIEFTNMDVRRVARQLAQTNPSRFLIQSNATARRIAMQLTSNKPYDGNYGKAVAQLAESCREASSVLFDVMSVLWMRIRDSKGGQWKHGLQALRILRNLILHGPLAAVAEATDGLELIRELRTHNDKMRTAAAKQIRDEAGQVYLLLVDRARLFSMRRVCANTRRRSRNPPPRPTRDSRLRVSIPFNNMHAAVAPNGQRASVVAAPPPRGQHQQRPRPPEPTVDLLGFASPELTEAIQATQKQSNDVLGLFDSMSVSSHSAANGVPAHSAQGAQPPAFATQPPKGPSPAVSQPSPVYTQAPHGPSPTIAQLPPAQAPKGPAAQPPPAHNTQTRQGVPPPGAQPPPAFAQPPGTRSPPRGAQQQRAPAQPYNTRGTQAPPPPHHQQSQPASMMNQQQQPPQYRPGGPPPPQPPHPNMMQQQQQPPLQHPGAQYPPPQQHPQYQMPGYAPNPGAHPAYPGQPQPPQQPNMFAPAPPAAPQQTQPQRKNLSQFDPMSR